MNDLEIYLKAMAGMFERMNRPSIEAVVLKHGEEFKSPARPRPKGIRKRTNKLCFMNSYHLAESRNMTYVEGFAISKGVPIPLHHAWVVDQSGEVIETTWRDPGDFYFGIALDLSFIHHVMFETRMYGVLDTNSLTFRERFQL